MCARVCPTEVLCEQACVRNTHEDKPVEIGLLQRHATDHYFAKPGAPMFQRAAPTGRRIAVVGAGPAGLSCAHRAALLGHDVTVFDAKPKPGGLNEYGLATYKTVDGFAQKEIDWLLSIGGIELQCGQALGEQLLLDDLTQRFDAVFIGVGLGRRQRARPRRRERGRRRRTRSTSSPALRQVADYGALPVGRRVVVLGGGMTAVDAAVQSRKLGAEVVTIVYRRDQDADAGLDLRARMGAAERRDDPDLERAEVARGRRRRGRRRDASRRCARPTAACRRPARPGRRRSTPSSRRSARPSCSPTRRSRPCACAAGRIEVDAEGRTSLPGSGPAATARSAART